MAAFRAPRRTIVRKTGFLPHFTFLIPAHNEEKLLPGCLESLAGLDYPAGKYSIYVVVDNCTDQTASAAVNGGAKAHVRQDPLLPGKGNALNWLFQRLNETGELQEAVVILDADSLVSENFLQVMAAHLESGERAVQAFYTVRSPQGSWSESLRFAAFTVLHYLRPQGRMVFGGSAGLKGNGMVFSTDLLRKHIWSASVTEDIELHMALLLAGERVTFAPDAVVWGEMPGSLARSRSQHVRWEQGRLQMVRQYVPRLLGSALEEGRKMRLRRVFLLLDAVMEHLIPPFSVLIGITSLCLAFDTLLFFAWRMIHLSPTGSISSPQASFLELNLVIGAGLMLSQLTYLLAGLFLTRAPGYVYFRLLYAPFYVMWKIGQYGRVLVSPKQKEWVRTSRNSEV